MDAIRRWSKRRIDHLMEVLFNTLITHIPIHSLRLAWLRWSGATIGDSTSIFRNCTVLNAPGLTIGSCSVIGWRCVLDARGGIKVDDRVVVASDTQLVTAQHDPQSPTFEATMSPIIIGEYAWLATRSLVGSGISIGRGAVIAAGAVVVRDVPDFAIVGGVPARRIGVRTRNLEYDPSYHPPFY